jgi:pyroglutamyl-peptidase
MAATILVTGFGPFPGAPFNPTGPLVQRLARLRRPALANVKLVPYIFSTSYTAVDRDLPKLIARHQPDALLMFGLATRTPQLRIETRARNALALMPDATGTSLHRRGIAAGAAAARRKPGRVGHERQRVARARLDAQVRRARCQPEHQQRVRLVPRD